MDQMILKYSFFKIMLNLVFRKIKGILMSKIKVLKNFSCNGVKKKIGQFLSKEDKDIIGENFGKELLHKDFLQMESEPKPAPIIESNDSPKVIEKEAFGLDELDKPGLWRYAKNLGLNPHHNTGENKLKEMIKKNLEA